MTAKKGRVETHGEYSFDDVVRGYDPTFSESPGWLEI